MRSLNIVTVFGARPQFIKSAPVSRTLSKAGHREFLVHTGQHYDDNMSASFFRELKIREPDVNLGIGSSSHGKQTGQMLIELEKVIQDKSPDWVLVYGDTNSTLAGALAAAKLHIPIAHVEAGLRSFNKKMPEEINRILTDHMSDLLFCPTQNAKRNLELERITKGVHLVGDVMYDSMLFNAKLAEKRSIIMEKLNLTYKSYALATVHRPENTDNPDKLRNILRAFQKITDAGLPVILPLHPRTANIMKKQDVVFNGVRLLEAVPYLDMLIFEKNARVILTDSGGVQKEAYWFNVPCITLREETEWVETIEKGCNALVGSDLRQIVKAAEDAEMPDIPKNAYGDGHAAEHIVSLL
jgi:UDP-N-acetylglucosamine 2-epimerase